jgi:hypothetical protein
MLARVLSLLPANAASAAGAVLWGLCTLIAAPTAAGSITKPKAYFMCLS